MGRSTTRAMAFAAVAGVLAGAGGCTFLISFDDKPLVGDAGTFIADASPRPTVEDARTPEPELDGGAPAPGPKCDPDFDRAAIKGCEKYVDNGQICGDSTGLTSYPPSDRAKDVVTCGRERGVLCVQHCATACAHLPQGFPDQCDDCAGKADKLYCGIEMGGWATTNYKLLVRCREGRMVEGDGGPRNCPNGCEPSVAADARCL